MGHFAQVADEVDATVDRSLDSRKPANKVKTILVPRMAAQAPTNG
jgi:hypothetical protein